VKERRKTIVQMKIILFCLLLLTHSCKAELNSFGQEIYSFDNSWAIMSDQLSGVFGNKQAFYDDFMDQCRHAAGEKKAKSVCDDGEKQRIHMNRLQPAGMRNYTELGFAKIRAPEAVFSLIAKFWEENKHLAETEWKALNPYHNMWAAPPELVSVQDEKIPGGGEHLQSQIWESSRKVLEEWTGQHLAPCSMWGIRIYHNNSILTPHVDRNPLVTSAIINVDQDVDEDWLLEVWGHDGKPYNISMKPGDMVLYESHSLLHGRPVPMRGKFYANIFIHFEPVGALAFSPETELSKVRMDIQGQDAIAQGLPPYIIPGSVWATEWRKNNPRGWQLLHSDVHTAARTGDLRIIKNIAIQNPGALHEPDENGWHPIHEAVRAGHFEIVKLLVDGGADVNEMTNHGKGYSLLTLAKQFHDEDHKIIDFLQSFGALELGPEL